MSSLFLLLFDELLRDDFPEDDFPEEDRPEVERLEEELGRVLLEDDLEGARVEDELERVLVDEELVGARVEDELDRVLVDEEAPELERDLPAESSPELVRPRVVAVLAPEGRLEAPLLLLRVVGVRVLGELLLLLLLLRVVPLERVRGVRSTPERLSALGAVSRAPALSPVRSRAAPVRPSALPTCLPDVPARPSGRRGRTWVLWLLCWWLLCLRCRPE